MTAGGPDSLITVSGSLFLPRQPISLYWDQPNRVSGAVDADASGNFTWKVKPFPGDPPGLHKLCASVAPNPCAFFTLQAAAATPSPVASPSPEPSPSIAPPPATPPRGETKINPLDVILRPPFVILPIIGGAGLLIALMYLLLSVLMRPRQQTLKSATVGHLASRPDYSAGFGAPPVAPAPTEPMPSAWSGVQHTAAAPPSDATAEEAELPPQHRFVPPAEEPPIDAPPAPAAGEWAGEESGEPDPLLAAWSDVLPPRTPGAEAPPPTDAEGPNNPQTKPPASHDDPLDFPEPGD
ncbi:MAG: hypothetical protein PVSMB3_00090 [Candidatus Dormibacteraceae bacterium]